VMRKEMRNMISLFLVRGRIITAIVRVMPPAGPAVKTEFFTENSLARVHCQTGYNQAAESYPNK